MMKLRKLISAAISLTVMCGAAAPSALCAGAAAASEVSLSAAPKQADGVGIVGEWNMIYAVSENVAFDIDDMVFCLSLKSDGTGTVTVASDGEAPQSDNATWSLSGNTLTIVDYFEGSSEAYTGYLNNNLLSLTGDNGITIYFARHIPGDPNSDGSVDAKDASFILSAYARSSTGGSASLSELQTAAADVLTDGAVDARDASLILSYYSYVSTGGTDSIAVCIANARS